MSDKGAQKEIQRYVAQTIKIHERSGDTSLKNRAAPLIEESLSIIPPKALELFLGGERDLTIFIGPGSRLPMVMKTSSERHSSGRVYTIQLTPEHLELPKNVFMGNFLRELGHVVNSIPPMEDWPSQRKQRAQMKERMELRADAVVWQWGLKHYNISYIMATYPQHIADQIISDIEEYLSAGFH